MIKENILDCELVSKSLVFRFSPRVYLAIGYHLLIAFSDTINAW